MFEKMDSKIPQDYLGMVAEIMSRYNLNASHNGKNPETGVNSSPALIEAMNVIAKAQVAIKERELELVAKQNEVEVKSAQIEDLNNKLATLTTSFNEAKQESIQVLASNKELQTRVDGLEAESKTAKEAQETADNASKEGVEKLNQRIAELENELKAKNDEFEAFKAAAEKAGAEAVGATEKVEGSTEATKTDLTPDELIDKAENSDLSAEDQLMKEYDKLETAAYSEGGTHIVKFAEFCKNHAKELGLPL